MTSCQSSSSIMPRLVRGMMLEFDKKAWQAMLTHHATDVGVVVSASTWPEVYDFFNLGQTPVSTLRARDDMTLPFSLLTTSPEASWTLTHEGVRVVLYPDGILFPAFRADLLAFSSPMLWKNARRYWQRGVTQYVGSSLVPQDLATAPPTQGHTPTACRVGIVGGGVAGASLAKALLACGIQPLVFDKYASPAQGASALYAALFHEHRQGSDSPLGLLTAQGAAWMRQCSDPHIQACGVLDICRASDWAQATKRDELRKRYPLEGVDVKAKVGWVPARPARWYADAGIVYLGGWTRSLMERVLWMGQQSVRWKRVEHGWGLWREDNHGARPDWTVDVLFLAMGADGIKTLEAPLPLTPVSGQIALGLETDAPCGLTGVTGDAYWVQVPGFEGVGATFEVGEKPTLSLQEAYKHNRNMGQILTGLMEKKVFLGTYKGTRAVSHDRLPWCGAMPDHEAWQQMTYKARPEAKQIPILKDVYVLMGLGSRGATWAGLLGEHLVREALSLPPLLSEKLKRTVQPARDWARSYQG